MTRRPALVLALALVPEAAVVQVAEVGIGASLGYAQYLDIARQCCPPLVWAGASIRATVGGGQGFSACRAVRRRGA